MKFQNILMKISTKYYKILTKFEGKLAKVHEISTNFNDQYWQNLKKISTKFNGNITKFEKKEQNLKIIISTKFVE